MIELIVSLNQEKGRRQSFGCFSYGPYSYIQSGDILIGDRTEVLYAALVKLAEEIKPRNLRQQITYWNRLPEELSEPETAWPWMLENMPWIFDGIDTSREPYAQYLKARPEPKTCATEGCVTVVTGVTAKYCSDACKQAAYRARKAA